MQTKQCPKCKEEILLDAKKCKHCGSDIRNWFMRHKVWSVILGLIVLGIIVQAINPTPKETQVDESAASTTTNESTPESDPNLANESVVAEAEVEDVKNITKENCDKVATGMSGAEVKAILGEPNSTSESEIAGIGKSEFWQFQEGFSLQACSVILSNGKVSSKTWTDL